MTDENQILHRAAQFIQEKQYDRARILLEQIPDHPKAQSWLSRLDQMDPAPQTSDDVREELDEVHAELVHAEHDVQQAEQRLGRQYRVTALLVFLGTLVGSLLGAADAWGGAEETFRSFEKRYFYPELCIVGSDTILGAELGLSQKWAETFEDQHEVRVEIDAIGSTNGLQRAIDGGCAHALAMSSPLDREQYAALEAAGVEVSCAAEIGYDVIVFIRNKNNPVEILPENKIRQVLFGKITQWSDFDSNYDQPITILARRGSGTTDVVLDGYLRVYGYDSQGGEVFPDDDRPAAERIYVECDSNEDCLNRALGKQGSLYWASVAWLRVQPQDFLYGLIIVDDESSSLVGDPLHGKIDLDEYPNKLVRPLYLYTLNGGGTSGEQHALAEDFIRYVRSIHGQAEVDRYFYTYFNQPIDVDIFLPEGFAGPGAPDRDICQVE